MCSSSPTHLGVWGWEESRQRDAENSRGHIRAKAFHPAPQHEGDKRKKGSRLLCVSLSLQKSSSGSGTSRGRCRWADSTGALPAVSVCIHTFTHRWFAVCIFVCATVYARVILYPLCRWITISLWSHEREFKVIWGKHDRIIVNVMSEMHRMCINNSVSSKSKTTKPKSVFGLLYWQSPVTYQNMAPGPLQGHCGQMHMAHNGLWYQYETWYWEKTNSNQPQRFSPAWWRALHWWGTIKKTVVKKRI